MFFTQFGHKKNTMKENSLLETGVVQPAEQILTCESIVRNDQETQLVINAKNRLIDNRTQQLFKGAVTGKHYLVFIDENPGKQISVSEIEDDFTPHGRVNPRPAYQRPAGQHSPKIQKGILLDFLCGERVGTLVLYQPENKRQMELVDGGQRSDIVRKFTLGKINLTGQQAAKFWAYYLPFIIEGHKQKFDTTLQIECNKLLKAIASNKTIPTVSFGNLPPNVRSAIRRLTFDSKTINKIVFQCIEDDSTLTCESPDYDGTKVIEMVRAKFNKLNLQQKPVQPIHQIWGSRDEYNLKSRGYVESIPGLMSSFGYLLSNDGSSKDEETIRTFNDLMVRSMLGFDGKVKWGLGITKVAENLLDSVYDDEIPTNPNAFEFVDFMKSRLGKVFSNLFYDKQNNKRKVELAKEMVGVGQKAVMQRLYILSLMEFWIYIQENSNKTNKYINSEKMYDTLYNYVELLSKVISCVSMRTLEKEEYGNMEKPLKKYGLYNMYKSNQKVFDNLIRLGGHSQKDDHLVKPTLRSIVEIVDEYTI
jgi:hypothetical protein